jgi:tetratricopeptide (TPR) repeat protein
LQPKYLTHIKTGCVDSSLIELELDLPSGYRVPESEHAYDIVLTSRDKDAHNAFAIVGGRLESTKNPRTYSFDFLSQSWRHIENGTALTKKEAKRIMENADSLLINGGKMKQSITLCSVRFNSNQPRTIQDCEEIFFDRQWKAALKCYQSLLSAGAKECLPFLRTARLKLLLEKPDPNSTLQLLSHAADPAQRESDADECRAWAERTMGDVHYRLKEYADAARRYERALRLRSLPPELSAVVHSDCAAAKLMAGDPAGADRHKRTALQALPDLAAHHVLGTMGTEQYGDDARLVIERALKRSHHATSARPPSEWHRRLHSLAGASHGRLFRARGADAPGHPCAGGGGGGGGGGAKSVSLFCRLRGQTPGTAEQVWGPASIEKGVGGSEEAAIYLSRQLAALGYCVRVYGNPPMEEWGADDHGVAWLPFWAYRSDQAPDVFVSWRNFDAVWLAPAAGRRYIWVHDPLALASDQDYFAPPFLGALAGIFVLSNHSASQFPPHARRKLLLTSNGLAPHLLRDGPNDRCQLLYSSWPSSGLELLLELWPGIRAAAPCATLNVYYGFDMWSAPPPPRPSPPRPEPGTFRYRLFRFRVILT